MAAASALQRSAFAGQTALKQQNELVRKVGVFEGRISMRRTVKSASQSMWYASFDGLNCSIYPSSLATFLVVIELLQRSSIISTVKNAGSLVEAFFLLDKLVHDITKRAFFLNNLTTLIARASWFILA